MSSHFQNRLVGVIVIVALGVIFLPDILDGKKQQQEEQFAEIPLRPVVKDAALPQQAIDTVALNETSQKPAVADDSWEIQPAVNDTKTAVVEAKTEAKTKTETKTVKAAKKVVTSKASAWTIQLGSFKSAENVQVLVKRLRSKGFTAYTIPTKPIDGQLTKVFVGPNISKDKLAAMQSEVHKLTKLKGRIVAYNPVEK
ncbi:SPOR domain-containing protein [Shewanella youngdeokensis]|uniref:SPOR domain-containing protein n=1 Tax=Shewanella youngdeokensis TaxID=2999068 RepID=A0ABZ0JUT3_9GAMM|nr:SPOR domain-containing protein [Shewanella sp. DAU334]